MQKQMVCLLQMRRMFISVLFLVFILFNSIKKLLLNVIVHERRHLFHDDVELKLNTVTDNVY